jgi:hypothetical protein
MDRTLEILLRSAYYKAMNSLEELDELFMECSDELSSKTVDDAINTLQYILYTEFLDIL